LFQLIPSSLYLFIPLFNYIINHLLPNVNVFLKIVWREDIYKKKNVLYNLIKLKFINEPEEKNKNNRERRGRN